MTKKNCNIFEPPQVDLDPFHDLKPTISNFGLDSDFKFNWQICPTVKFNFFHLGQLAKVKPLLLF